MCAFVCRLRSQESACHFTHFQWWFAYFMITGLIISGESAAKRRGLTLLARALLACSGAAAE